MRISARNVLKGKVKTVTDGAVNSEVMIVLPGGQEVVAIVTKTAVGSLGLVPGKDAYAIIKASSVMIGVDH
jgi:molybdopterin-binding protein